MLTFNDYLGYAKHQQEIEDTIERLIQEIRENNLYGESLSFNVQFDDDMTDDEIAYIEREVRRRV